MLMNYTASKINKLNDSKKKCTQIIEEIIANKKYHKKELLQPVIDKMDELINLAEKKLND